MSEDRTYNGWTNYETWAVGMYLDGNYTGEHTYLEVLEIARERRTYSHELADALRAFVEEDLGEFDGLAGDLMNAALSEVNWQELAEHKLAEIKEQR